MEFKSLRSSLFAFIVLVVIVTEKGVMAAEVVVIVGPGLAYDPQNLEVNAGDTVVWKWAYPWVPTSKAPHTVTRSLSFEKKCDYVENYQKLSKGIDFDSGIQTSGYRYKYTFDQPGLVTYHCETTGRSCLNCNLGMWGTVNVVEFGANTEIVDESKYKMEPDSKIIDTAQNIATDVAKKLLDPFGIVGNLWG